MAQPVKGISNPPQSESQAVQPTTAAKRPAQKPATAASQDTVRISSEGRAASEGGGTIKTKK
jgi:hypothetical protein